MEDLLGWLSLGRVHNLKHIVSLLGTDCRPADFFALDAARLRAAGQPPSVLRDLANPDQDRAEQDAEWLATSGWQVLPFNDPRFPAPLRELPDCPVLLYIHGDVDLLTMPQLAIVGSRTPTPVGAENATQFAAHLAARGLGITSGLAAGVDAAAHRGALAANGATLAVMGTGPDVVYPARHRELAARIASDGLLVTEFPPGHAPSRSSFPRRNRIISGMSLGALVVEAARNSGSLITARLASEQGREVFAIPGSIHNPLAKGCHALIRNGAKLVESAADIWEELAPLLAGHRMLADAVPAAATDTATPGGKLDPEHAQVLAAMGWDKVGVDVLVERCGLTPEAVSSILLLLELNGHIAGAGVGSYVRLGPESGRLD